MAASEIRSFVERAKATGISDEALVGMLTARGWPEKDVYQELAVLYEGLTGIEIPNRRGSGAAAKDAFFYLLTFAALATWTIGLASLAFTLIEHWFADTLFNGRADYALYEASTSMASVLLAYPLYLLLSRLVARETRLHPEKLNSPVRKWLTYMALVIAAGVDSRGPDYGRRFPAARRNYRTIPVEGVGRVVIVRRRFYLLLPGFKGN